MALSTRSGFEPIPLSLALDAISQYTIIQYFQVATLTVLCYDAVITFDREVKYFWKIPRRPVDFVYFLNRYIGIFGSVATIFWQSFTATLPVCNFAQWTLNVANWIIVISIDYILMIRVLALYSQDRRLSIFLKSLLAAEAASKLGLIVYMDVSQHVVVGGFPNLATFCASDGKLLWELGVVDWVIPLTYGTLLMVLALYKAAEYWRMSSGLKGFALVKILIEDQVMYFFLVISCTTFAIMEFRLQVSNIFLSNVLNNLGNPTFLSILGSRMLFNLKEAGERGENEGTSYRSPSRTMSDMDFADPGPVNPQRESETEAAGIEGRLSV